MADKAKCQGPNHDPTVLAWPHISMQAVEQPYNPEWQQRIIDAGTFCSYGCLADYADARRSPDPS